MNMPEVKNYCKIFISLEDEDYEACEESVKLFVGLDGSCSLVIERAEECLMSI